MGFRDLFKKKKVVVNEPVVVKESVVVEEPVVVVKPVVEKPKSAKKTNAIKVPVDVLYEKCRKAVRNEIAKDHHEEAFEILELTTEDIRKEFLRYHEEDKGNICCMVLDKAKQDLIADGKLKYNPEAAFGHPFML
jgi:hypothetical protein